MAFEPNGTVYIGHVDWDDSYRNVRLYTSSEKQLAGILGMMEGTLTANTYTYVRKDSVIRVAKNAEQLYLYNYVAYRNSNYSNKMFYAFITGCDYINETTTALHIETDVMQTWMFDYQLRQCFIEREHVDQDTPGLHTVPEPSMPIEYTVSKRNHYGDNYEYKVVVQTNSAPLITENAGGYQFNFGSQSVVGGFYNNVFSGAKYYAFDPGTGSHDDVLFTWLNHISKSGGTEGISNIFMFPKWALPEVGSDNGVEENTPPKSINLLYNRPTQIAGYTPKNNKLLSYPYTFLRVGVPGRGVNEYRYEDFNDREHPAFNMYIPLDADAQIIVVPVGYKGVEGENFQEAYFASWVNKLSWVNSAFDTWMAQNALGNVLSAAMAAIPLASGVRGMAAAGEVAQGSMGQASRSISKYDPGFAAAQNSVDARANAMAASARAEMASGAVPLANQAAEVYRMSMTPAHQCGSSSGNGLYAVNGQELIVDVVCPRLEYLEIIDDFFSRYGYEVDKLGNVDRTSRKSWNYCKTRGCCVYGDVPDNDARVIESVYDAGVTFWHVDDIGNYELDNSMSIGR